MQDSVSSTVAEAPRHGLLRGLNVIDAGSIVAGSMIGSGIFIVSADIARAVATPGALLAVWAVSGLMTIAGALAYGELAAMLPEAGGQYAFLREAWGEMPAFLFGWTLLLVIQTGTIAAVAVAFARFAGVLFPVISWQPVVPGWHLPITTERLLAIGAIAILTAANSRGLQAGRLVQNFFTSAKMLSLLLIIVLALVLWPNAAAVEMNFGAAHLSGSGAALSLDWFAVFGAAMVGALFSLDAWASVTFVAPEVRNPRRDVPLALLGGTVVVVVLCILVNVAYLAQLPILGAPGQGPFAQGLAHAVGDRVATAAMQMIWPAGGVVLTAVLVMMSTFGCANGLILTGARVLYAMAHDGQFYAVAGRLNRNRVPGVALWMQGAWSSLLVVSGTYSELLDYVIFAQLLFYVLTVAAVFRLRRTRPELDRPYRTWCYPYLPAGYLIAASALMVDLLIEKPRFTWPGLFIVMAGIPVYLIRRHRRSA